MTIDLKLLIHHNFIVFRFCLIKKITECYKLKKNRVECIALMTKIVTVNTLNLFPQNLRLAMVEFL